MPAYSFLETYLLRVRRIGLRGNEMLLRRISAVCVRLNRGSDYVVLVPGAPIVLLKQQPVCLKRMVLYRLFKNTLPPECQIIPITTPREAQLRDGVAARPSYSVRLDSFGWSRHPQGEQANPCQATTKLPYRLASRERSGFSISQRGDKLPPFLLVGALSGEALHRYPFLPCCAKQNVCDDGSTPEQAAHCTDEGLCPMLGVQTGC
jgi:hypothetical protein